MLLNKKVRINYIFSLAVGVSFFIILALTYILAALALICNAGIHEYIFVIACICGVVSSYIVSGKKIAAPAATIILSVISVLLSMYTPDFSYDGTHYHQETIVILNEGWNPWYSVPLSSPVITHYAKGMEIMEAAAYSSLHNLEAAKCVNLFLIFSAFFIQMATLMRYTSMGIRCVVVISLIALLNPVGLAQVPTFYIDYTKYYIWIITFTSVIWLYYSLKRKEIIFWILVLSLLNVLAFSTKFNIGFEQFILLMCVLVWSIFSKNSSIVFRKKLVYVAIVTIPLVMLLCSHPYLTNWVNSGHPLYPLCGSDKIDIMTSNTPAVFMDIDRFSAFCLSLFRFIPPVYDTRIGGFGPFILPILALTIYALVKYRKIIPCWILWICTFVFVSCFLYDQSWWARYICQLWLIPVGVCIAISLSNKGKFLIKAICVLSVLNGCLIIGRGCYHIITVANWQKSIVSAFGDKPVLFMPNNPQLSVKAKEYGAVSTEEGEGAISESSVILSWNPLYTNDNDYRVVLDSLQWQKFNELEKKFWITNTFPNL